MSGLEYFIGLVLLEGLALVILLLVKQFIENTIICRNLSDRDNGRFMSNIVYIATSLDGYIARKDGSLDWLMEVPNPENSDYGFFAFLERIDGIIMGRTTFETVAGFNEWPYTKPVFVLSNTLEAVPDRFEEKAKVINGDLRELVDSLNNQGYINLYIDGGKTIQGFLKEDLIDELILTRIPRILGSGIPLFAEMDIDLKFELAETEILNEDLLKSTYLRRR